MGKGETIPNQIINLLRPFDISPSKIRFSINRSRATTDQISRRHSSGICRRLIQSGTMNNPGKPQFPAEQTEEMFTLKMGRTGNVPVFHSYRGGLILTQQIAN